MAGLVICLASISLNPSSWRNFCQVMHPPQRPCVRLQTARAFSLVDLRDLWSYREILFMLAVQDIKLQHKQTMLSVVWVVLQPGWKDAAPFSHVAERVRSFLENPFGGLLAVLSTRRYPVIGWGGVP
jgi:hypothetical protein